VLGATTRQGRGAGTVSPLAYSTPAHTNNGGPQRGNAAKKERGKLDTDNGARYKAAEKRSAKTDTEDDAGYDDKEYDLPIRGALFGMKQQEEKHLAEFNSATVVAERRGKIDTENEAEYNDKEGVLPVTDALFGVKQQDDRRSAEFNTATVVAVHRLEIMQRAFPPQPANVGKKKNRVLPLRLLKLAGYRVRLTTSCIS
jgi:hypothetical protein